VLTLPVLLLLLLARVLCLRLVLRLPRLVCQTQIALRSSSNRQKRLYQR
jgi:hypothetical protein